MFVVFKYLYILEGIIIYIKPVRGKKIIYIYVYYGTIWVRTRFNNIINNFMTENIINIHLILKRNRYDKRAYSDILVGDSRSNL